MYKTGFHQSNKPIAININTKSLSYETTVHSVQDTKDIRIK